MPRSWPFMGFADAEGGMLFSSAPEASRGQALPAARKDIFVETPLETYTRGRRRRLYRSAPSHWAKASLKEKSRKKIHP